MKTKPMTLLYPLAGAALLTLLVTYVNESISLPVLSMVFPIAVMSIAFLMMLLERSRVMQAGRQLSDELVESMHGILFFGSKGMPLPSAVALSSASASSDEAKRLLHSSSKKLMLGEQALSAFADQAVPKDVMLSIQAADWSSHSAAIASVISSYGYESENRKVRIEESIQRYATVNMFLSTILPSFIVFAFIGSMLLSQKQESMMYLSIALLIALPVAYAVGNSMLSRRLFG